MQSATSSCGSLWSFPIIRAIKGSDHHGGDTCRDGFGRYILGNHGSRTYYRMLTNGHSWQDDSAMPQPGVSANSDRLSSSWHLRIDGVESRVVYGDHFADANMWSYVNKACRRQCHSLVNVASLSYIDAAIKVGPELHG